MHVLVHEEYLLVKVALSIFPMNFLLTRPQSRERTRVQILSASVRTLGRVKTHIFILLVDPCAKKGEDLRGATLERLASSQQKLRKMKNVALILFFMRREVLSPCGTPASHTMRVSLVEAAQY